MKHEFEGEFWESLWDREHKDHEEREEDSGESGEVGEAERVDEAWMNRLDAIASGDDLPSADDDELLHVAGQLSAALTPLRNLDSAAEVRKQRVGSHLRTHRVAQSLSVWGRRSLVFAAALLIFLLLGPGLIFMVNFNLSAHRGATASASPTGQAATASATTRSVPALPTPTTRFDLIRISTLPAHEHLIDSGLDFVAGTFFRYYAQYRITGQGEQDIFFYEQPSLLFAFPLPSTSAQAINVHGIQAVTFRNTTGYYTIRWTQDNLTCQLASLLPTSTLLAFTDQFEVVTVEHKADKR